MWHDILKSKAHWNVLSRFEENLSNVCEKNGLPFTTYTSGLTKTINNNYTPSNNGQYEFLHGILERTLRDMARGNQTKYEMSVSQPARLGEAYMHVIALVVEDASFYLYFNCIQTEPSEQDIFRCEISFTVPEKFWGDSQKIQIIRIAIENFVRENGFQLNAYDFGHKVLNNLDIYEEATEVVEETETPIEEGTVRERWWE